MSDRGHDITILDNLSRRKIDIDLEVGSLTPIVPVGDRIKAWRAVSGREIGFVSVDLAAEYDRGSTGTAGRGRRRSPSGTRR